MQAELDFSMSRESQSIKYQSDASQRQRPSSSYRPQTQFVQKKNERPSTGKARPIQGLQNIERQSEASIISPYRA